MKKRYITLLITAVLTVLALFLLTKLVMPKYQKGIVEGSMIAEYYEDTVPHEVLFIGDCEVYENVSTVELYQEYGISSYIRGSAQQLIWQSYYLLEDTLRYETPDVVVFNVLSLKYNTPQSEAYNRMSIDGMRWSQSKWDNIQASMTEDEHVLDYIFPFLRYHSRWSELNNEDIDHMFNKDLVTHNGYYMRVDISPQQPFPPAPMLVDPNLGENAMSYLSMMADLCEENGIALVLIKAPTEYPYWYDEWDNQVRDFASERGLDYFNYIELRDEMGIDMSVDTYDAGLHLNLSGAEKFADYIGAYLTDTYDLTDYRNVPEVAQQWDNKIEFYNAMRDQQYAELEQYGELISFGMNAVTGG